MSSARDARLWDGRLYRRVDAGDRKKSSTYRYSFQTKRETLGRRNRGGYGPLSSSELALSAEGAGDFPNTPRPRDLVAQRIDAFIRKHK